MPLVVASSNCGKIAEFRRLLPNGIELLAATDVSILLPPETGTSYTENALIKARSVARAGYVAIADDSGLEVDALNGNPGVLSARFGGDGASDDENNQKLLEILRDIPEPQRGARFRSAVAIVTPSGLEVIGHGSVIGRIVYIARGGAGFGYDPLFEVRDPDFTFLVGRTAAELTTDEKNTISHRARAVRHLLSQLSEHDIDLQSLTGVRGDE